MKTYLEIQVPIKFDALWFQKLRASFTDIPVRWQEGYYHITVAFCDEATDRVNLKSIAEHLRGIERLAFTFDQLDAFKATSGMYIIHLGVSDIPKEFTSMVNAVRTDLIDAGCIIESDFKLHVTLGRVLNANIDISEIKSKMKSIYLPSFSLKLTDAEYRVFRGRIIKHWRFV